MEAFLAPYVLVRLRDVRGIA
ncbi:hypothetical protein, partial [Pseudomonas aeruginosa]